MATESAAANTRRREVGLALLLLLLSCQLPTPVAAWSWPAPFNDLTGLFKKFVGDVTGDIKAWLYKAGNFLVRSILLGPLIGLGKTIKEKVWAAYQWIVDSRFNPFSGLFKDWAAIDNLLKEIRRLRKWNAGPLAECYRASWSRCTLDHEWDLYVGIVGKAAETLYCAVKFAEECGYKAVDSSPKRRLSSGEFTARRAGPYSATY